MIYFPLSKLRDSSEAVVASGVTITAEGQALVRASGANASGVTLSTGSGTSEVFAGFAVAGLSAAPLSIPYVSAVETYTVPVGGTVTLQQTNVAGQISVFDNTTGAAVTINGTTITNVNNTVTGLTAGDSVTITYKYAPSVVQARALVGDVQPGGYAGLTVSQVGVVKRGVIYTTEFDASKNWAAATGIKLAANGQITDQSGTGTAIQGYVVAVPTATVPFLGIEFSAA
jgi:hypothetical protein